MQLNYNINWTVIRIPILPWLKITKIEPKIQIREVLIEAPLPTPEPEESISTRSARPKWVKKPTSKEIKYPSERRHNPNLRHFRLSGAMAGTEIYRRHHAIEDLIRFFTENNNTAMRLQDIRKHPDSPFKHNYVKCQLECNHRIISNGTLRAILYNKKFTSNNKHSKPIREILAKHGTDKIIVKVLMDNKDEFQTKRATQQVNGFRLSEEVYFSELNILSRNDFVTRTLAKEITVTTKKKTPEYGYQREAIDRMT